MAAHDGPQIVFLRRRAYKFAESPVVPRLAHHHKLQISLFCAELVASILKVGGLLDSNCNPGSATPEMLHRIYAPRAAVSANPCLLRKLHSKSQEMTEAGQSFLHPSCSSSPPLDMSLARGNFVGNVSHAERVTERESLLSHQPPLQVPVASAVVVPQPLFQPARRRADSPPRGHFQVVSKHYVNAGSRTGACSRFAASGVQLTMNSLQFGGNSVASGSKIHPR